MHPARKQLSRLRIIEEGRDSSLLAPALFFNSAHFYYSLSSLRYQTSIPRLIAKTTPKNTAIPTPAASP